MTLFQAAVLGIVQGLTEFLPVSSSAHLVLIPWIFQWDIPESKMAFDVSLHIGTLLAVVMFFFFEWLMIIASYIGDLRQKRWLGGQKGSLLPKVILGTIPAAIAGHFLEDRIDALFYSGPENTWVLACTLAAFGLALLISERVGKQERDVKDVTYKDALIIGCFQCVALIPGVSRSGVTIFAGLLLSLNRPAAARFSFLLSMPITFGAAILKFDDLKPSDLSAPLYMGVLSSAIVGVIAIKVLLKYVQTRPYAVFAYYRWALAALVIGLYFSRQKPAAPASATLNVGFPKTVALSSKDVQSSEFVDMRSHHPATR